MDKHYAHEAFLYSDGMLLYRKRPRHHFSSEAAMKRMNTRCAGKQLGTVAPNGYMVANVGGKMHHVHRIVWTMFHGPIPDGMVIDHINGDSLDNRIENLRLCSRIENSRNHAMFEVTSAEPRSGNFRSKIRANGRQINLGTYRTRGEAMVAYAKASLRYFGKYSYFYRSAAS